MSVPALFLDRDGTLVRPRHYPTRPDELSLFDGVVPELRRLQALGMRLVIITNQSGIAHGYLTEADLARMHAHLSAELAAGGVRLAGIYHCPHHPDGAVPHLAIRCACRKPEPGMLLRAAAELGLDLRRSWFVGDILDDVEAGNRVGCRTVLVDLGTESPPPSPVRTPAYIARDTRHALQIVRAVVAHGDAAVDLRYRPPRWDGVAPRFALAASGAAGGGDARAR
ncbi:MAG TPA: HAD family hydrolase [Chloroflexota bacterium]|nr:HAD family hydrolase [Chloroflexota bacterium]